MKIESFSLRITNFIYMEWVTRPSEKPNEYLISNAAFSYNISPPWFYSSFISYSVFKIFHSVTKLCSSVKTALIYGWFFLICFCFFNIKASEKKAHSSILFCYWRQSNQYNIKWSTLFYKIIDIINLRKAILLIIFSVWHSSYVLFSEWDHAGRCMCCIDVHTW